MTLDLIESPCSAHPRPHRLLHASIPNCNLSQIRSSFQPWRNLLMRNRLRYGFMIDLQSCRTWAHFAPSRRLRAKLHLNSLTGTSRHAWTFSDVAANSSIIRLISSGRLRRFGITSLAYLAGPKITSRLLITSESGNGQDTP